MILANFKERENALKQHIKSLSPELLREYLCEHVTGAEERTVDTFVVLTRAQNAVPAKAFFEARWTESQQDEAGEDEETFNDGEPSI